MSSNTRSWSERQRRIALSKATRAVERKEKGDEWEKLIEDRMRLEQAMRLLKEIDPKSIDLESEVGSLHLRFAQQHVQTLSLCAKRRWNALNK